MNTYVRLVCVVICCLNAVLANDRLEDFQFWGVFQFFIQLTEPALGWVMSMNMLSSELYYMQPLLRQIDWEHPPLLQCLGRTNYFVKQVSLRVIKG